MSAASVTASRARGVSSASKRVIEDANGRVLFAPGRGRKRAKVSALRSLCLLREEYASTSPRARDKRHDLYLLGVYTDVHTANLALLNDDLVRSGGYADPCLGPNKGLGFRKGMACFASSSDKQHITRMWVEERKEPPSGQPIDNSAATEEDVEGALAEIVEAEEEGSGSGSMDGRIRLVAVKRAERQWMPILRHSGVLRKHF